MSGRIGVGIIGMGFMGRQHTLAYKRLSDHFYGEYDLEPQLVVIADEDSHRAQTAAAQFGFKNWTTDWESVIDDEQVQAVSITTPNNLHREVALAAIGADKPFWIEKPLGRSHDETSEIASAASKAGVITTVGLVYRQVPLVRHIGHLIQSGELGDIQQYRGTFLVDYAADPNGALTWRFTQSVGGLGALGDLMSHVVDLAQFLIGPMREVQARQETFIGDRPVVEGPASHFAVVDSNVREPVENEDYVSALVGFEGGAVGTVEVSRVVVGPAWEMAFEVFGTKGSARWTVERMNEFQLYSKGSAITPEGYTRVFVSPEHEPFGRFQPGHAVSMGFDDLKVCEAFGFIKSIETGDQQHPSVVDMYRTSEVLAAMSKSAQSGTSEVVTRSPEFKEEGE